MATSYVEDIANAWFRITGYFVTRNVWFEVKGSRRAWTDIDILAVKPGEMVICSCKAFLGNKKADLWAKELHKWFEWAEEFVKKDKHYKHLFARDTQIKRLVVVDNPGSKRIFKELAACHIEICELKDCYREMVRGIVNQWRDRNPRYAKEGKFWLKSPQMSWGKEEGMVERLTIALLGWDFLKEEVFLSDPALVTQ